MLNNLDNATWQGLAEDFLAKHPNSPWAPSFHHDFAMFCRDSGRTSKALQHWETAWQLAKAGTDPKSKKLTGTILANWMSLLSSLGRLDELKSLIAIGDGLQFSEPADRDKFQKAKNAYFLMDSHPEIAYRCGTFALKAIGAVLQPTNQTLTSLVSIASPTNGFSLTTLITLSEKYGLNLVAVRRTKGEELIVPSLVHWRQNHYAAILERLNDSYLVSDPTFGEQKWLSADVINEEASGEFLVPAGSCSSDWKQLAMNETEKIHGMGLPNNIKDANDKGCMAGKPCPECKGMPVWWVSEPYINLWIADEPLSYLTSRGEPFTFRTSYKQRDSRSSAGTQIVASSTGWNHSWFSFIHLTDGVNCNCVSGMPNFTTSLASIYLPNGGQVDMPSTSRYDSETRMQLLKQGSGSFTPGLDQGNGGLRLVHADGSQDIYGFVVADSHAFGAPNQADFLLTRHIDPAGDTSWYYYMTTNLHYVLRYVVDYDGNTNTLTYTSGGLLAEVDNPYGLKTFFKYDSNANLTNIVDAAGLSSSLTYDTNGYPTALITPYGTNKFVLTDNISGVSGQGTFGGHNLIDRAVQVTDPVGANYLYLYRNDSSSFMSSTYPSSDIPTNTPLGTLDSGAPGTNLLDGICYLNSFYWGPRQFSGLSTNNMANFTTTDYLSGRMKHWLEDVNQLYLTGYVSIERDPTPDGSTEGLKKFYDYQGKLSGYNFCAGTNALPSVRAWRIPNGETHYEFYQYDNFGNITNDVTTYTKSDGSLGTRTNQFVYNNNTYTFTIGTLDASGNLTSTAVNSFVIPNVLSQVIGPDGKLIAGYGGFDTVTWTNIFKLTTQTNETLLASTRVLPRYVTNGVGQVATSTFTGFNKLASYQSVAGLTTTNIYRTDGFLAQTIDVEIGRTNSVSYYSTNGLISVLTNELGLVLTPTWDNLLRLTSVQFQDGSYISNRYDKLDLSAMRDRMGNWTYYGHDGARHLTASTNANNAVTYFSWCGCGALTAIIDPLTNVTSFNYDNQGNLTNISFPDASALNYRYDLASRKTTVIDGANRTWQLGYNNQGFVTVVSNAYGQAKGLSFDIQDRLVIITNENNVVTVNTFDPMDRILTRTWPNSATEGFGYSPQGLAFYTNQLNQVTRFGYDVASRKVAETNANNEITRFSYDAAGDLLTLVDGKNQTTTWTYDLYGNTSNKLDAANNLLFVYKYDFNNRLTNRTSLAKGSTKYKFDAVGNLTNIVYPVSSAITLTYDALNRITNIVDAVGTTAYTYSQVGQLLTENGPWANDTLSYTYANQLRTALSLTQPSGTWSQTYGYDNARRLNSLSSPAGAFGYSFFTAASRLPISVSLPNGAYVTNNYDSLARLYSTKLLSSTATVLDAESYSYDLGNERTQQVFTAGNFINYGYDPIGQLKAAIGKEVGGTTNRLQEQFGYGYDAANNLNLRTNNSLIQTFNVNNLNELTTITNNGTLTVAGTTTVPATSVTVNGLAAGHYADATFALGGFTPANGNNTFTAIGVDVVGNKATNSLTVNLQLTNTYSYDLNGNLVSDGQRGFDYDDDNELIRLTVTNNFKKEYAYDGLRRLRIRKEFGWIGSVWAQTNEIHYIYDGDVVLQQRDTNNLPTLTFTRGLDVGGSLQKAGGIGGLLAMTEGTGTNSYYHSDGSGNVMLLVNTNQVMVAKYEYDSFGNPLSISGPKAFVNPNWYSSQLYDPATGLSHYRFRVYVPELQRWLNRDSIEENGGINLFAIVLNNPINHVDFFGLDDINLYPPASDDAKAADRRGKTPGIITVGGHGNENDIADGRDGTLKPMKDSDLADLIRNTPGYTPYLPIRLYNCEAGKSDSSPAPRLSKLLPNPITASTESTSENYTKDKSGNVTKSEMPKPINGGVWKTFQSGK